MKATCRASAGLRTVETAYVSSFGRVERFDAANFSSFGRFGRLEGSGLEGRMGSAEEAFVCIFWGKNRTHARPIRILTYGF